MASVAITFIVARERGRGGEQGLQRLECFDLSRPKALRRSVLVRWWVSLFRTLDVQLGHIFNARRGLSFSEPASAARKATKAALALRTRWTYCSTCYAAGRYSLGCLWAHIFALLAVHSLLWPFPHDAPGLLLHGAQVRCDGWLPRLRHDGGMVDMDTRMGAIRVMSCERGSYTMSARNGKMIECWVGR